MVCCPLFWEKQRFLVLTHGRHGIYLDLHGAVSQAELSQRCSFYHKVAALVIGLVIHNNIIFFPVFIRAPWGEEALVLCKSAGWLIFSHSASVY